MILLESQNRNHNSPASPEASQEADARRISGWGRRRGASHDAELRRWGPFKCQAWDKVRNSSPRAACLAQTHQRLGGIQGPLKRDPLFPATPLGDGKRDVENDEEDVESPALRTS
jgi:hypothetical protein